MRRRYLFVSIVLFSALFAWFSRPHSLGARLERAATAYSKALSDGNTSEAMSMMAPQTAEELSEEFLLRLKGSTVPGRFRFDGLDSRGLRMVGAAGDEGSRVIWLTTENGILVRHDSALDNILGLAVVLCRENAMENPSGNCPVSGKPYEFDRETGIVVCPSGHLGTGLFTESNACALLRDSVAKELQNYLDAGYDFPESLEDMYVVSNGEFGKRGGYRCPDNGYSYLELRDGKIFCPHHQAYSEEVVEP